jgi:hypothetical protein
MLLLQSKRGPQELHDRWVLDLSPLGTPLARVFSCTSMSLCLPLPLIFTQKRQSSGGFAVFLHLIL